MRMLDNKVIIITGATSGIGKASAVLFAAEGARLVLAGRRRELGEAIAAPLNARFIPTDVRNEAEVAALIARTIDEFGRLDCLFNNPGQPGHLTPIAHTDMDAFDRTIAVNLRSAVLGMKHAAPVMIAQRSGSIINTASLAGRRAGFSAHDYSATKAALIHVTRTVAAELGESGVRVNSLSPGPTMTEIFVKHLPEETRGIAVARLEKRFATLQPLPRAADAADVARAALFLASDLSSFVSGHDLAVDGASLGGMSWTELNREQSNLRAQLAAGVPRGASQA
jgi:NAD(P)-dependent dehydrogenase (short-subunit alcohol dehydrogenase family)